MVLISSLLAWDDTPKNLEEIRDPADVEAEKQAALQAELDAAAAADEAKKADDNKQ